MVTRRSGHYYCHRQICGIEETRDSGEHIMTPRKVLNLTYRFFFLISPLPPPQKSVFAKAVPPTTITSYLWLYFHYSMQNFTFCITKPCFHYLLIAYGSLCSCSVVSINFIVLSDLFPGLTKNYFIGSIIYFHVLLLPQYLCFCSSTACYNGYHLCIHIRLCHEDHLNSMASSTSDLLLKYCFPQHKLPIYVHILCLKSLPWFYTSTRIKVLVSANHCLLVMHIMGSTIHDESIVRSVDCGE